MGGSCLGSALSELPSESLFKGLILIILIVFSYLHVDLQFILIVYYCGSEHLLAWAALASDCHHKIIENFENG